MHNRPPSPIWLLEKNIRPGLEEPKGFVVMWSRYVVKAVDPGPQQILDVRQIDDVRQHMNVCL